jgi:metallo-beta-lactamase family protein
MHITFYGAVREVTGSMHLISTETDRILLDCGMFQGRRRESGEKNNVMPFDPQMLTNMVLSHAHIDHSGRIPLLTRRNFNGRIICNRATAAACEYLLPDSANIQESDANYLNYKQLRSTLLQTRPGQVVRKVSKTKLKEIKRLLKKGRHELNLETINELIDRFHIEAVKPIYTVQDAEESLKFFDGYPYRHTVTIGQDITCTLYDAGHILGSAISMIRARENGRTYRVCYTGDLGRFNKPIVKDPTLNFADDDRDVDLLIMESTYGDRVHEPVAALKPHVKTVLQQTYDRGGTVIIPAFAYGRTQELLYVIHELYDEKQVPRVPVYVDSPLAIKLTKVFGEHPEVYDRDAQEEFLRQGKNPFMFDQIHFVSSVEESIELNKDERPHIVIAASGMCEAGRVLHHLRHKIHSPRNTILLVGYMARNTLGCRILDQGVAYENSGRSGDPPIVKILNKEYPLNAHVTYQDGFSGHADKQEMLRFLKESNLNIKRIALVHGEEEQTLALAEHLRAEGYSVRTPRAGETIGIS